jgi:hypothetical protein
MSLSISDGVERACSDFFPAPQVIGGARHLPALFDVRTDFAFPWPSWNLVYSLPLSLFALVIGSRFSAKPSRPTSDMF